MRRLSSGIGAGAQAMEREERTREECAAECHRHRARISEYERVCGSMLQARLPHVTPLRLCVILTGPPVPAVGHGQQAAVGRRRAGGRHAAARRRPGAHAGTASRERIRAPRRAPCLSPAHPSTRTWFPPPPRACAVGGIRPRAPAQARMRIGELEAELHDLHAAFAGEAPDKKVRCDGGGGGGGGRERLRGIGLERA